jgi:hypothetical protein
MIYKEIASSIAKYNKLIGRDGNYIPQNGNQKSAKV